MSTAELIKIGISIVVFALCFAGNIHFKGLLKNIGDTDTKKLKSLKKRKTLCFVGVIISIWFAIGVVASPGTAATPADNANAPADSARASARFSSSTSKTGLYISGFDVTNDKPIDIIATRISAITILAFLPRFSFFDIFYISFYFGITELVNFANRSFQDDNNIFNSTIQYIKTQINLPVRTSV